VAYCGCLENSSPATDRGFESYLFRSFNITTLPKLIAVVKMKSSSLLENLKTEELEKLAEDKLKDAKVLFEAGRYDGAFYICGYAVELGLKKKMCSTLGWDEYPSDGKYKILKTHDIEVLLHFSGAKKQIKKSFIFEWSTVIKWNPEIRYSSEARTAEDARFMIESAETILRNL
jgi:HEPN domain-containing protein